MPKQLVVTPEALEAIQKSIKSIIGDADAERVSKMTESFGQFVETLEEVEPVEVDGDVRKEADGADGPVADTMRSLYTSVATINKSKVDNKDVLLQAAFEKAFDDLQGIVEKRDGKKNDSSDNTDGSGADNSSGNPSDDSDQNDGKGKPVAKSNTIENILKSAKGPVKDLLVDIIKQNADLAASVKGLQDERTEALFKSRAKAIGESDATAVLLKSIAGHDPKLAEAVTNLLKGKNDLLKKSNLFSEIGSGDGAVAGGTPLDQLNGFAAEIHKGAAGKLTLQQAFLKAAQAHPDVYAEYSRTLRS